MGHWELERSGAIQPGTLGYGNCNDVDGDDCCVRSSWIIFITALQPSTDMSKSKAVLEIVMMVVLVLWRKSRINMI